METKKGIETYKRLLGYIKPMWLALLITFAGNTVYASVDSYITYLIKPIINEGFVAGDHAFLRMLPLMVIGLFLIRGTAGVCSTYFMGFVSRKIVLIFRQQMFQKLMKLPASYFDLSASGKLLSKITYNVDQVTQATGDTLTTIVRQGFTLVGLIIVMFVISWQLTLITFLILPVVVIFVKFVSTRFRKLSRRIQNGMGDVVHLAEESVVGYREVKIFGAEQQQNAQFNQAVTYNFVQEMKMNFTNALNSPVIQFLCSLMLALVIYLSVGRNAHIISAGSFVAFFGAMGSALKPVRDLSQVNNNIQRGIAAAESIFELLDHPDEVNSGTLTLSKVKGELEFKEVGFKYRPESEWALKGVNLKIPAGKTVAFVGRSGSGKSTLVSLLGRFYQPTEGQILLDGVDIQSLELSNLRSHVALVSQHVTLFDNTIFHNIAFGPRNNATREEVIAAAKAAHAWDFIQDLPAGLETQVGENGLNLSGGQRQRIAIARAILKNAPVLILDEATSALDNESERAIQLALETLKQGRTTLIVAHRLSTIEKSDMIVVMESAQIKEIGTHESLLNDRGIYAQLHQANINFTG
ncbi:MAG: lipid export permease/ATP-binding protein MsbA [Gammaproteobacteria bacterium]|jgi:subfamily B ATP-binding cassette protein MsbA|nr:lipid export permease/ATP-binding protein MsbA [Gammaproteobacteria bacterium]